MKSPFKGIVKPQKSRAVESIEALWLCKQSPMFFKVHLKGYSCALNRKKPVAACKAKKEVGLRYQKVSVQVPTLLIGA